MFCVYLFYKNLTNKKYLAIVHAQLGALELGGGQLELLDARPVQVPHHPLAAVQLRHPRPHGHPRHDGQGEGEAPHG